MHKRPAVQPTADELERRALLQKDWSRFKFNEKVELRHLYESVMKGHRIALYELRKESEELYQAAIQPDDKLMSITVKGPVATPPIVNYVSPAEYRSISFKCLLLNKNKIISLSLSLFRMAIILTLAKNGSN